MISEGQKDLYSLLAELAACFPRDRVQPEHIAAYAKNLGDLELAVIEHAIRTAINESERFPTIAELRRRAKGRGRSVEFDRSRIGADLS